MHISLEARGRGRTIRIQAHPSQNTRAPHVTSRRTMW